MYSAAHGLRFSSWWCGGGSGAGGTHFLSITISASIEYPQWKVLTHGRGILSLRNSTEVLQGGD